MKTLFRLFTIFLFAFLSLSINAQTGFTDNFNDSNFTANPSWTGETSKFQISSAKELQLNHVGASGSNEASLVTSSTIVNNATWEVGVRLGFSPSSSNFAKIYLVSDNQDLTGSLNGYYVKVGGQTGTVDDVKLYRQDGASDSLLIDGIDGTVATNPSFRLRVTKSSNNQWSLYIDPSGAGNNYQPQGTATEGKYNMSAFFGVYCKYTSTRSDKFFFDNFLVSGVGFRDTLKPVISQVNVINDRKLNVSFNEKLDATTALNLSNYSVNNGIGNPSSVTFTAVDSAAVELSFTTPFNNGDSYTLTVQNVRDTAGNTMESSTPSFTYFIPVPAVYRDVVINELFADFTPTNGLPEAEFVELFNASTKVFDLSGWNISDGTTNSSIGSHILRPGDYIVLCAQSFVRDYQVYGTAQGLSSFPTLNNSGDAITLKDNTGRAIDFVNYEDSWYKDPAKTDGGYTLEQINPYTKCTGQSNFTSSISNVGGTPSAINSTFDTLPDNVKPELIDVTVSNANSLNLVFSENMDSASVIEANYNISPSIQVANILASPPNFNAATLTLTTPLDSGTIYSLSVTAAEDCIGNTMVAKIENFAIPSNAESQDIIINEVLFNSRSGSKDFVELYNRSNKVITLQNWQIANYDETDDTIANLKIITINAVVLFPEEYAVLTEEKADVLQQYPLAIEQNVLEINDLPTYNDDDGRVYLFNANLTLIDEMHYEDDYHFALLNDDDGVSLERINSEKSSLDETNWHSASEKVGFATPGYKNSQDFSNPKSSGSLNLDPNIVSPDGDGFQDVLSINYKFNSPGFVANVIILDKNGRVVKRLVNNELLGAEGTFFWDGITDNNSKARIGVYVVLFEAFNLSGEKEIFKEVITVASQLK